MARQYQTADQYVCETGSRSYQSSRQYVIETSSVSTVALGGRESATEIGVLTPRDAIVVTGVAGPTDTGDLVPAGGSNAKISWAELTIPQPRVVGQVCATQLGVLTPVTGGLTLSGASTRTRTGVFPNLTSFSLLSWAELTIPVPVGTLQLTGTETATTAGQLVTGSTQVFVSWAAFTIPTQTLLTGVQSATAVGTLVPVAGGIIRQLSGVESAATVQAASFDLSQPLPGFEIGTATGFADPDQFDFTAYAGTLTPSVTGSTAVALSGLDLLSDVGTLFPGAGDITLANLMGLDLLSDVGQLIPPFVAPPPPTGGGRGGGKRRRMVVELDNGQQFVVASEEEAQSVVDAAKRAADSLKVNAPKISTRPAPQKGPVIDPAEVQRAAEERVRERRRKDDEEALFVLMH